jgi:hypothetical protein
MNIETSSDVAGSFEVTVSADGRYSVSAHMAAFAPLTREFEIGEANRTAQVVLELILESRAGQEKATLDLIGVVQDAGKRPLGQLRDTVNLAVKASTEVERKNVQYDSGFVLPAGKFHLKFVVRENQTGRMGSFETDLTIPDLKTQSLKMSSVILSSQIQPAKEKKGSNNPLLRDGSEVIPSVTRVFAAGQHLYLY